MPVAAASFGEIVERVEGDHGVSQAILAELVDAADEPLTEGEIELRVAAPVTGPYDQPGTPLVTVAMEHFENGTWRWVPEEPDLKAGTWRMQVGQPGSSLPVDGYGTLVVIPRLTTTDGDDEGE